MSESREETELILAYAEKVKITASWNPEEFDTVLFKKDPPVPEEFSNDTKELIEFCFAFYQRAVFTGELEMNFPKPAELKSNDIIKDLNLELEHYRDHFIYEVKRALGLTEQHVEPVPETEQKPRRTKATSPYAKAMLQFRKEQKKTTK